MWWLVGAPGHPPGLLPLLPLPQPKLTPQEKLKLRMQKALNRQCMSHRLPRLFPAPPRSLAPGRPCPSLEAEAQPPPLGPRGP